jgi:hypothetical protein
LNLPPPKFLAIQHLLFLYAFIVLGSTQTVNKVLLPSVKPLCDVKAF